MGNKKLILIMQQKGNGGNGTKDKKQGLEKRKKRDTIEWLQKTEDKRMKTWIAELMLLSACVIWGSGFAIMKDALDAIPPNYILAFRFSIAALAMGICIAKKLRHLTKKELLAGLVLGALMYLAYTTQTIGLKYTTAGKNAFLTAVYVALVPFMMWGARHIRPDRYNVIAAVLCLVGIGILSLVGDFCMNFGDMLTLVCSVLFGVHIVGVSFFAGSLDVMRITWLQFLFSALFAWCGGGLFETFPTAWTGGMAFSVVYLGIFATLAASTMMNVGIKYVEASHASLLMSTEAFFGCLSGVVLLGEPLGWRMVVGGALILAAMVISETKLSFLKNKPAEPAVQSGKAVDNGPGK